MKSETCKVLRLVAFTVISAVLAQAAKTTLTGTITDSQGNPLNGTLTMRLPVPAQDQDTNTAVAVSPVYFRLVNGAITGGSQLYDVGRLQPAGLYYLARAFDTSGNLSFYGAYIVTGATFNLGQATPTSVTTANVSYLTPASQSGNNVFSGTNTFSGTSIFSGTQQWPSANTFTTFNNICVVDGVTHTSISSCVTALPANGGQIYLPAGTYTQALGTLTFSKAIRVTCENPFTTAITFTGSSGVGVLVNYQDATFGGIENYGAAGFENCALVGPGGRTGSGNAGTGIQLGDATHSSIGFILKNSQMEGWATALTWGNGNSFAFQSDHSLFIANTQDVLYNLSTGIGCANCRFSHTAFQGSQNANAIQFSGTTGGDFTFDNCFIADDPVNVSGSSNWRVSFVDMNDFENTINTTNKYVTVASGTVTLTGLNIFQQTQTTGAFPAEFIAASGGFVYIRGMYGTSNQTMTALAIISGSVNFDIEVVKDVATGGAFNAVATGSTTGLLQVRSAMSDMRLQLAQTLHFSEVGAQANQLAGTEICYGDNGKHDIRCSMNGSNFHQVMTGEVGGCTMSAGTTCTANLGFSFTNPLCFVSPQVASTTVIGQCAISGTTVTVTATAVNSNNWNVLVIANPN